MAGEAKQKARRAQEAAASTGRVPISVDTTLRLSRLWFEMQGAQRAAQQAQAAATQATQAYVEGLSGVVEALDLGIEAFTPGLNPGEQTAAVSVDFKAKELVLPKREPPHEPLAEAEKTT